MNKLISMVICGLAAWSAAAATIGYWPMNVTTVGGKRLVKDVSGHGYDFTVRAESDGGSTFADNDIGWAQNLPPNPDASVEDAGSRQMLQCENENKTSNFSAVLSQTTGIRQALSYENDFTLEGWFRAKMLPNFEISASNKFIFAFNALGEKGGWSWYLTTTKEGTPAVLTGYAFGVEYNYGTSRKAEIVATIPLSEAEGLKKWNHLALVVKRIDENYSSFSVYVNGRNYGTLKATTVAETNIKTSYFNISGASSSASQQSVIGDITCWRASDAALEPGGFLCDVPNERTVAYWPMKSVAFAAGKPVVASAIRPFIDLTLRNAALGGISFVTNDVGWLTPPNPGSEFDPCSSVWQSETKVETESGEKSGTSYQPVFTSSDRTLLAALTPTNSFCVEGWYKPTTLPAAANNNHMFVYHVLGQYGGWCWNLYGADGNGDCAIKLELAANRASPGSRTVVVLGSVKATELDGKWNHYALVHDAPRNLWKFYLNGSLRGVKSGVEVSDVSFPSSANFFLFGCGSGTAQIPIGNASSWRVSRGALASSEFLCGATENALVWTGAANAIWSTGTDVNWEDNIREAPSAWMNYARAVIDDTSSTTEITLGSKVVPEMLSVDIDRDVKIVGASGKCIDAGCQEITKTGSGTLWFYSKSEINDSANDIHVREGTLRVTNPNAKKGLGDSGKGYSVYVHDGARLWVDQRNSIGNGGVAEINDGHITVYTNGIFDLTHSTDDGNSFNIQVVGTLDLLGGSLVLPTVGHSSGCIQVRDRVTFGCNPTKTPYVFNPSASGNDTLVWQLGANTEFRVEDITGDAAADVTFNNHVLAKTAWETDASHPTPCGFRKTGAGTMVLAQSTKCSATELCVPSAGVSAEEGELRVDCAYGTSFNVASGAVLSGSGSIASATFADGAGLGGELGRKVTLTVTGDCALGRVGTIALTNPNAVSGRRLKLLHVEGTLTGGENLENWTVLIDGQPTDEAVIKLSGNDVIVHGTEGILIIVR